MKKFISFILSLSMLLLTLPAYAAGGDYERVFSAADTSMKGFEIAEGYTIDDNGLSDKKLSRSFRYTDKKFSGKYQYEITFKSEFENGLNILFNYVDKDNYSYIEIQPEVKKASLKAISNGVMTTGGLYDIENEISSDVWVTAKIISNGGRGISLSLSTGGEFSEVFADKYLKNGSQGGYIGYDASGNPLAVKNIKVKDMGEADFVEPQVTSGTETEDKNDEAQMNTQLIQRSDDVLKLICGLGIMKETANGLDGAAYVELGEMQEIAAKLKWSYTGTEQYVTERSALDFIFSLLRCTFKMTYAEQYKMALNMELLKKTTYDGEGLISRYDLAQLIYNSLDQQMFDISNDYRNISNNSGSCLFNNVLKLKKVKGQVTDNGITALDSKSKVGVGNLIIGGISLQNKTDWRAAELIGRMVEGYYNEENELLYVKPLKNEKLLHIDALEVEDFSNNTPSENTLTYENKNTNKKKTASVKTGAYVIYNGEHMPSYGNELFETIENGSITLVSSDGTSKYDTVIIEAYENFVIASVFEPELAIYNAAYDIKNEDNRLYKIDLSDYEFIEIFSTEGIPMTFEDLKVDQALSVAASNNYLKLIVSTTQEAGFAVSGISTDYEGRTVVSNGEKSYAISPSYFNAYEQKEIKMGEVYTFLINAFGDISWSILSASYQYESGCLARVTLEDSEDCTYIHLFEADGEIQHFKTAEKIKLIDAAGNVSQTDYKGIYNALKDQNELVTYRLNSDDRVAEIQLPYDGYKKDCPNKFMKLCDGSLTYENEFYAFNNLYFLGNAKRVFTVNSSESHDPRKYGAAKLSQIKNGVSHTVKCYAENSKYLVDYAIIYDLEEIRYNKIRENEFIVTDVRYELKDDEVKFKITGYSSGEKVLYCDPEVAQNAYDIFSYGDKENAQEYYTVQKGDIIKYCTDIVTGEVTEIFIFYRSTEPHPETGSEGWILGADSTEQNPFSINDNYITTSKLNNSGVKPGRESNSRRYFYGWVYDMEGGVVTVTTQDLNHYGNYYEWDNPESTEYISEYHTLTPYKGVTLSKNDATGKLEVSSSKNIRTFKQYGTNCSRVLLCSTNEYYFMVVLNN